VSYYERMKLAAIAFHIKSSVIVLIASSFIHVSFLLPPLSWVTAIFYSWCTKEIPDINFPKCQPVTFRSLTDFKRFYKYLNTFRHFAHTFCRVLFGVHWLLINSFSTQISVTVLDLVEHVHMICMVCIFS